jgi:hypothetical protein
MDTIVSSKFLEITNLIESSYKEIEDLTKEKSKIYIKIDDILDRIKGYKDELYNCPCGKRVKISTASDHNLSKHHILYMAKRPIDKKHS